MEYCGPRALPHSQFLGWSQEDQDKAIAWLIEERTRCGNCGGHPEEWVDADGIAIEPPPYTVKVTRCLGCVALDEERSKMPEEVGYNTSFQQNRESG